MLSGNILRRISPTLWLAAALCVPTTSLADEAGGEAPTAQAVQQAAQVTGNIVDENGDPLIGVTVKVRGTHNASVTNSRGEFTIAAKPGASLEISYIGYFSQTVKASPSMKIQMEPDITGLDDVLVIGYGTMKKRDLTGSISTIKSEDIVRSPTSNVMEAIQGKVAGLDITKTSGDAGAGVDMLLRGTRSINGDNTPLFIIDGMEGSYDELNPNDIASIEVLKDASSTAIYGSAGANGVVIITTKDPQKNRFTINFDAYWGWNTITAYPDMNTGEDYINFRREAQKTAGYWSSAADDANLFPSYIQNYIDNDQWVDWFDLASGTGMTSSYNLSTSYANDRVSSYLSLSYYDVNGILKNDEMTRYSARAKIDYKANNIVKYGLNVYATYSENDKRSNRIWNRILNMPPVGEPYDADGNLVDYPIVGSNNINPIADTVEGMYINNIKTLSVMPQAYVEITPVKGLSFKSVIGGYFQNTKQSTYAGTSSYQGLEYGTVQASIPTTFVYNYKWQNILNYIFDINEDHDLSITLATEWTKKQQETATATANDFDSNYYGYHNLGAATGTPTVSSSYVGSQMMSYIGRINYAFKGRYLASVSARIDGSSVLAEGHKWATFPSAAIGWRMSDEPFMKGAKVISNLKWRLSYGVTGNSGAEEYATLNYGRTGIFGFQDTSAAYSGYSLNVANQDLTWEKSYMVDFGFDLGLFKDRLSIGFDWYRTDTKDVLYEVSLPYAIGGYGESPFTMWSNVGKTRNSGVEVEITSHNFVKKDFTWTTTFTLATNSEKVLKTTSDGPLQFGDYYLIEGQPIKTYYGFKYVGIWGTAEEAEAAKYGQSPGQVHIAENGEADYVLNEDDYYVLGNATPKWTAGMVNSFTFKGFDLSFQLIARWGYTINYGLTGWYRVNGLSPSPTVCDYWTEENQSARYPRPDASVSEKVDYQDWINFYDGSYIKIKNITLGYTLPKKWLKAIKTEKARIYFTADNPFVFTMSHYLKGYDPEKGGDDDVSPLTRQFVFGLNFTF